MNEKNDDRTSHVGTYIHCVTIIMYILRTLGLLQCVMRTGRNKRNIYTTYSMYVMYAHVHVRTCCRGSENYERNYHHLFHDIDR
jgi:hypothetical protein